MMQTYIYEYSSWWLINAVAIALNVDLLSPMLQNVDCPKWTKKYLTVLQYDVTVFECPNTPI